MSIKRVIFTSGQNIRLTVLVEAATQVGRQVKINSRFVELSILQSVLKKEPLPRAFVSRVTRIFTIHRSNPSSSLSSDIEDFFTRKRIFRSLQPGNVKKFHKALS